MKITFIGGGNMGEAILSAVLDKEISTPDTIAVSDVNEERRQYLRNSYRIMAAGSNRQAAEKGEVVVLAIKPQNLDEAMANLKDQLKPEQLVLSIIAGARINTLREGLNHECLVRAMPNTPAQIGRGITMWTATSGVSEMQKGWAGSILSAMGQEIYVEDEKYIDMATAISGSGPAYVFLFMESLVDAAIGIGLSSDVARELVMATVLGSGQFALRSGKSLKELREMVTSPGGTTAEALLKLESKEFSGFIKQAVNAAYDKAKSLGI